MANQETKHGEVLVAIIDDLLDFARLREEHWYRIPVKSVEKWLGESFPPKWIAFYQTKIFGNEGNAINYIAKVKNVQKVRRYELFPKEPKNYKSTMFYYKISIGKLQPHPKPIISRKKGKFISLQQLFKNSKQQKKLTIYLMIVILKTCSG